LTFAVNAVKSAAIIGMFPKPLKPCVVLFNDLPLDPEMHPVLYLVYYPTFHPRFDKLSNLSDLWLKNVSRKWRNLARIGIINPFVKPFHCEVLIPHSTSTE
jgi:hypothetical protein